MILNICLIIITLALVTLIVYLINSLQRANQLMDRTSILVENINKDLPEILTNIRNTSANTQALSESLVQGVHQAAASVNYIKSFATSPSLNILAMILKGIRFIRTILKKG